MIAHVFHALVPILVALLSAFFTACLPSGEMVVPLLLEATRRAESWSFCLPERETELD
jgi:hypothetical protein